MFKSFKFLLFAWVPVIGSWSVNLDILLETDKNCHRGEQCQNDVRVKHSSDHLNISLLTFQSGDSFAEFKAIRNFRGDVGITSKCASFAKTFPDPRITHNGYCCSECFMNSLHLLYPSTFQQEASIYNGGINKEETKDHKFLEVLSYILTNEKLAIYIAILTSVDDSLTLFHLLSEGTLTLSFDVDQHGHFSKEHLKEIFETFDEDHLNFVVICSTDCITHLMNNLQATEVEVGRSAYFKRSRWMVVPTNGLGHSEDEFLAGFPRVDSADISIVNFHTCQNKCGGLNIREITRQMTAIVDKICQQNAKEATGYIIKNLLANEQPAVAEVYTLFATNNGHQLRLKGNVASDKSQFLKGMMFERGKYGFNNRTFIVGILPWHPFVFKKEINGRVEYSGLSVDLLHELARRLNFSYVYKEPDDKEWGRILNGKWTGLVGEVSERKIDLVGCPLTISYDRETVMDFSSGYYFDHAMIIFEKQNPNANKWLTLVAPLRYEVLICIFVSLILCTLFLFFLEEVNPGNIWADNRLTARWKRYGDILWYHFGALMANGGAYLPNTVSGRSVLACWWIFTVMVAAIYSGNLIAFLAVNRQIQPFTSISEMIKSDYKWGLLGGSAMVTLFKNSNVSDYKQIWKFIEKESAIDSDILSLDTDVHLKKVLSEKYAFIGETTTWDVWQRESCELDLLGERFYPMTYAMGFQNNSIHTKVFSDQLQSIQESGLVEVWHQRWLPAVRCEKPDNKAKRADILALQSVFYAAAAGVLLAVLILTTEHVYNRRCKGHQDLK